MPIRTVIQDRRRLLREGLRALLESQPDIEVVGVATTFDDVFDLCKEERPDVVVLHADAPGDDTVRTVMVLHRQGMARRVVGVYASAEPRRAVQLTVAGIDALVPADTGAAGLLEAVRNQVTAPGITRIDRPRSIPETRPFRVAEPVARFTEREGEVLQLVATGSTTREISLRLGISAKTVENHKHRIFSKLGVHNQAHAVAIAMREGLLPRPALARSSRAVGE